MNFFECYDYTEYGASVSSSARMNYVFITHFIVELSTKINFDLLPLSNASIKCVIQRQH
jgi:hypothetical protein